MLRAFGSGVSRAMAATSTVCRPGEPTAALRPAKTSRRPTYQPKLAPGKATSVRRRIRCNLEPPGGRVYNRTLSSESVLDPFPIRSRSVPNPFSLSEPLPARPRIHPMSHLGRRAAISGGDSRESRRRAATEGRVGRSPYGRLRSPPHRRRTRRLPRGAGQDALRVALPPRGTKGLPGRKTSPLPVVRCSTLDRRTARRRAAAVGSATASRMDLVNRH